VGDLVLDDVIAETNALRADLGPRSAFDDPAFLHALARRLQRTAHLRHQPIVQCFIEDALAFGDTRRLTHTKSHIREARDHHLFSLFNASYFPKLSLDYLTYRPLPVDEHLAEAFPSGTTPVNIERMTDGFASRVVVALFPENHVDGIQRGDDRIFYFIDKFIHRHKTITRPLIDAIVAPGDLRAVRAASDADIEQASSWWVWLHEYHHRQGDMPIPAYLPVKSLKPLAGLEELRVDVSGLLVCLNDDDLPPRQARLTYELVLAERLLRYAVEGIPKPNYDAVASQLLFNYLLEAGGLVVRDGVIHLQPRLPAVLEQFLGAIHAIERRILVEPAGEVQRRLLGFTNEYTIFDEEIGDYRHLPFFAEVKQRLGL
jgi:hypothetical protein